MLVRSELLRAEVELARIDDLVEEADGRVRDREREPRLPPRGAGRTRPGRSRRSPIPVPSTDRSRPWLDTAASRPDLVSARKLLAAGELEEKVRKAPYWPKLAFVARGELYGEHVFGSSGTNGALMAVATWNVFAGGSDHAAAIAAREEARAGREDVARFDRRGPPRGPAGLRGGPDGRARGATPPGRRSRPPARPSGSPTRGSGRAS